MNTLLASQIRSILRADDAYLKRRLQEPTTMTKRNELLLAPR